MSTAIVFDCRSRGVEAFAASVTQTADRGLVIRKATEVGGLADLGVGNIPHTVIILGSYAAQSSGGFVEVVYPRHLYSRLLAGGAGIGWSGHDTETGLPVRRGDGLRPITDRNGERFAVTVVSGGCVMTKVTTHKNSNPATATAALAGLRLRAEMRGEVLLIEGQSDHVSAWALKPASPSNGLGEEFPVEHRPEVFDGTPRPAETLSIAPAVKRVRKVPVPPVIAATSF